MTTLLSRAVVGQHRTDLTPRRRWAALSVLVLAVVLLAVDGTVLSLAVPSLTAALQPSATELLWIGDVYSFALAGLLITMGALADRIGRKRLLLIGSTVFGLASAAAALAPTAEILIATRVLQGAAAATLMPSTLGMIRNIFTDARERTTAIAIWSAAAAGGAALGPLVGGLLLEHFWWGSVFMINVPIMAVLVVGGIVLLPESRDPRGGHIDLASAALSLIAVVAFVFAIKETASYGPSLTVAGALVLALIAGGWFVARQRSIEQPLIDLELFKRPAFAGAVSSTLIAMFAFSGLLFFFSQYLQLVRGYSPLQAGLRELPLTVASIVVVALASPLVRRVGLGRVIGLGLFVAAVGLGGLAVAEGADNYVWLALALAVVGLGFGLSFTLSTDAAVSSVSVDRAGSASAVSETSYELGVALGIAVLGSLQTVLYRRWLELPAGTSSTDATAVHESATSALETLSGRPDVTSLVEAVRTSFTEAMQVTSVTAAVLVAVAAVVAWRVIPSVRTRTHH